MNTVAHPTEAFAIWLTGLPASGKSTIAACLKRALAALGVNAAVLESDSLRKILTPNATYSDEERDRFYQQMADLGALLTANGIPVIFDATANRRAYRDRARARIPRFAEIYVDCPLEICMARDPKGIYRAGGQGGTVPGLQTAYEPPEHPALVVHREQTPEVAAHGIVNRLMELGFLS